MANEAIEKNEKAADRIRQCFLCMGILQKQILIRFQNSQHFIGEISISRLLDYCVIDPGRKE